MELPLLSVIICTHNPRSDYLIRVLAALKAQTLPQSVWELLLIDNASDRPLAAEIDLSWHCQARHTAEKQLGLTAARLCGMREAKGETLVFVDDDNVLDPDYLEVTLHISKDYPFIGAWGGQVRPEFEAPPPVWTKPYWVFLAIREFDRDEWTNVPNSTTALPCGAGLCVRRSVAQKYVDLTQQDSRRLSLGRIGANLSSCEDSDLALTAMDVSLATGRFTTLKLSHLLPPHRLQEPYLLKLVEGTAYSIAMLNFLRKGTIPPQKSLSEKMFEAYRLTRISKRDLRFHQAKERGITAARQHITAAQK